MEIKYFSGGKSSPRKDHQSRPFKARINNAQRSNVFDAIAKASVGDAVSQRDEDGVVRMKILVRKQDLKQMLEVMGNKRLSSSSSSSFHSQSLSSSLSLEQRINFLRKKQIMRASSEARHGSWSPVLQSIPEDF